jgi:hypothetical protein
VIPHAPGLPQAITLETHLPRDWWQSGQVGPVTIDAIQGRVCRCPIGRCRPRQDLNLRPTDYEFRSQRVTESRDDDSEREGAHDEPGRPRAD